MRILIVVDTFAWAIGQLAEKKIKYNQHFNFKYVAYHPRDCGSKSIQDKFLNEVEEFNPDIIHFEYFRTASQLLEAIPELKKRKIILTHHNQKDKALGMLDWHKNGVDFITCFTNKCRNKLVGKYNQPENRVKVIHHGIDLNEFSYSDIEPREPMVGYVGRVVPWKGLKEIARACKELGYKVLFMGKQDKADYWREICNEGLQDVIDMSFYDCRDEDRKEAFKNMTIYVGNSEDGLEEGPLGYLEAMASGVPVVTTLAGVADDIAEDESNCLVVPFNSYDILKNRIKKLMEDKELRQKLRSNAWNTVKNLSDEKMCYDYQRVYYGINNHKQELVSVILPFTQERIKEVNDILNSLEVQTYPNFEVVLANDSKENLSSLIKTWREMFNFPIKYIQTNNDGYGLAQARNMATIEAFGKILMFLDSRLKPNNNAIELFAEALRLNNGRVWVFGNKGANKNAFVENFSAIKREDYIKFGMSNERINGYGGMSQELRTRWNILGGKFLYLEEVVAKEIKKASKDNVRRKEIADMKFKLYKMYGDNTR